MQTFLPSSNFTTAAHMLDSKRLNKQILEAYQILNVLSGQSPTGGWRNHPAVKMWRGHEMVLLEYIYAMISEAKYRGIKTDTKINGTKTGTTTTVTNIGLTPVPPPQVNGSVTFDVTLPSGSSTITNDTQYFAASSTERSIPRSFG